MTSARAAVLAALLAAVVYLPALGNTYALDDGPIVERNPAAHSIGVALRAFDEPYWPAEHQAGQYRPLVVLSFAVDWTLSGGSTTWLHASNALWHALATSLLVMILLAYVSPAAALAGGAFFGTHPVHVEAVANLVGRAELMAAVFLFAAILLARAVRRRRAAGIGHWPLELLLFGAVGAALVSKEHAAIAVALLALDDWAGREAEHGTARLPWRDYAGVLALTVGWLLVRRHVEGGLSFAAVAPTFFGLDAWGRISTMLPVVFVLIRLLVWPFDLSPDYHPRVVERLTHPSLLGVGGLALLLVLLGLAILTWRRRRGVSVGLWFVGIAWLPTANLLFPTGVVIAERTLYLASAGAALLFATLVGAMAGRWGRPVAVAAVLLASGAFAVQTARQAPVWASNRDLVLYALGRHPESYRVHQAAARVFVRLGNLRMGLREYGVAAELYPLDHYLMAEAGSVALDVGSTTLGLRYLRQAERLDSLYTLTQQLLARALLEADSATAALGHARAAVRLGPRRGQAARMLAASFVALGQRDSALAVWPAFRARGGSRFEGWLFAASTHAALSSPDSARLALDSALAASPGDSLSRAELHEVRGLIGRRARGR